MSTDSTWGVSPRMRNTTTSTSDMNCKNAASSCNGTANDDGAKKLARCDSAKNAVRLTTRLKESNLADPIKLPLPRTPSGDVFEISCVEVVLAVGLSP